MFKTRAAPPRVVRRARGWVVEDAVNPRGFGSAIATVALVLAANARHPQGDITRAVPYALAVIAVWAAVAAIAGQPRRGVIAALSGLGLLLLVTSGYVLLFYPSSYAECGVLISELSNDPCRSHSALGWFVLYTAGAILCVVLIIGLRQRHASKGGR